MNALNHPVAPVATLRWLLKREYWEHRGGFLYAPLIAGLVSLAMTTLGIVLGLFALRRAASGGELRINDTDVNVNGLDLGLLTRSLDGADIAELGRAMDLTLLLSSAWPFIVLGFVVFFYCLGALYDDRRDRSILFWKSLPLSDTQTVLSKVLSAVLVAPLIAVLAAILTMLSFMAMLSVVALVHGGSPATLLWGPASPLRLGAGYLTWIPVHALWALPTAGWLLLCSAWARSKPFLWAVMLPVFAGAIVSTTNIMPLLGGSTAWFWRHVVGRLLLGVFPGSELAYGAGRAGFADGGADTLAPLLAPSHLAALLALPDVWIGAAVGLAFIVIAIRLRRRAGEL